MAQFTMELPEEIMRDFQQIYDNADNIFGQMTKAGAEAVLEKVRANVPESFRDSEIMNCLKITKVYKTPTDGGVNTKVGFFGYFKNKAGRLTPAPLVANVFEYGTSNVLKQPFLRKSFNRAAIERAMLQAQKQASGGLLDE
ncbi:MAG: hypothetical protein IKO68_08255 [Oscillospiraceae bacterium]|nr:hypothetical protein [Oscillospiraceae bacterium]